MSSTAEAAARPPKPSTPAVHGGAAALTLGVVFGDIGTSPLYAMVEQYPTESTLIEGDREPYESERREQKLVRSFTERLERQGHEVCRLQFLPEGEAAPLFSRPGAARDGRVGHRRDPGATGQRQARR